MIRAFPAIVARVLDGDTIDADCDLGFRCWARVRFRLAGVDAPESGAGRAARDWLASKVEGKTVTIESMKLDKYGRYLARVTVDGVNLNDELLRLGLAVAYRGGARTTS